MIIEEILEDDPTLIRRYSNTGYYIKNNETGFEYAEAIDLIGKYTYSETNRIIEPDIEEAEAEEMKEALSILLGQNNI